MPARHQTVATLWKPIVLTLPTFWLAHSDTDSQASPVPDVFTQLLVEILEIDAAVNTSHVEKHLVNRVLLNARCQRLQMNHDPVRHRCV